VEWNDKVHVVYALTLDDLQKEVFYTVHILDNGDWFLELGGNPKYLALGGGKYLSKHITINAGVASKWGDLLKKNNVPKFYIGFSIDF